MKMRTFKTGISRSLFLILSILAGLAVGHASAAEQSVSLTTADGVTISAVVDTPDATSDSAPAVIFIHQGGSSKTEWRLTNLYKDVIDHGMIALAYDVRGHGASGGEGGASLFNDPNRAPLDLKAAIEHLSSRADVDPRRIAIVGSSIGANLACVAVGSPHFDIRAAVAISGKTSAVFNLAGGESELTALSSVYLIASEAEQDGQRARWASQLYELAEEPKQLEIVKGSSHHGTAIFHDDPSLQSRIMSWLEAMLTPPN